MELLLVDDFPVIVQSLQRGIDWKGLGFETVHTASSAKEAKLLLTNFPIDIMICDIEMPEENGLELVRWTREHIEGLEVIFLTSHAEFDYVVEAMHLGSFDYVLQPVKFEDVIRVVEKVKEKVNREKRYRSLEEIRKKSEEQGIYMLERILAEDQAGNRRETERISGEYLDLYRHSLSDGVCYQTVIDVVKWKSILGRKSSSEVIGILKNTMRSLADADTARIAIAPCGRDSYWLVYITERSLLGPEGWQQQMRDLHAFICRNMDFMIAVYYADVVSEGNLTGLYHRLIGQREANPSLESGMYLCEVQSLGGTDRNPVIGEALRYIEQNLNRSLSRTDVANAVSVSEEYFSRLFRQEMGSTFKEYVQMRKMEEAKKLLDNTDFSIGIIASKVGYTNFSHFSQVFRTYTGMSPQEFRSQI